MWYWNDVRIRLYAKDASCSIKMSDVVSSTSVGARNIIATMALLAIASVGSLGTLMTVAASASDYYSRYNTLQLSVIPYTLLSRRPNERSRLRYVHVTSHQRAIGSLVRKGCSLLYTGSFIWVCSPRQHWVVSQRTYPDDPHATAPLFKLKRYVTHR